MVYLIVKDILHVCHIRAGISFLLTSFWVLIKDRHCVFPKRGEQLAKVVMNLGTIGAHLAASKISQGRFNANFSRDNSECLTLFLELLDHLGFDESRL